jgi:hypothetical protein
MRREILIVFMIISIIYCFQFGYILTSYAHGGQLIGIPFTGLIVILTMAFLISNGQNTKRKLFHITFFTFSSLAGFSLTIELIRNLKEDYFRVSIL